MCDMYAVSMVLIDRGGDKLYQPQAIRSTLLPESYTVIVAQGAAFTVKV